jgi:hypothetical protein
MSTIRFACVAVLVWAALIATVQSFAVADQNGASLAGGHGRSRFWIAAKASTKAREESMQRSGASTCTKNCLRPSSHQANSPARSEHLIAQSKYRLLLSCEAFGTAQACAPKSSCEIRRSLVVGFWGAQPGACATSAATPVTAAAALTIGQAPPPLPQVTPGLVLTAFREIGLPALEARTQPEDKTLVNFATIFYTAPQPFTRTVTLLGRQVQVTATPSVFIWHYGDGTTATTATPGAPYPAKHVTHDYVDAHVTVRTSVDVTYSGRFRVDGGPWQTIPGTVTITGPTAPLRVSEATPLLSGNHQ